MKKETKSTLLIPESNVSFDTYESRKSALLLRAVNNKVRHKIINILYNYEKENKKLMTVTELYVKMRIEQSVASQHLAILRKAGIVKTTRVSKFIHYGVDVNKLNKLYVLIININNL